jgi:predicted nucleotidyltransferase
LSHDLLDPIYEITKTFFPGYRDATAETVQAKKQWIKEALDRFVQLKYTIRLPLSRTRRSLQEVICEKLMARRKTRMPRVKRLRGVSESRKITEFLEGS